jgi:hypothetical protein
MSKLDDYTKGNTEQLASEWRPDFILSKETGRISLEEINVLFCKIVDVCAEFGIYVGGSMQPILDDEYEKMRG